MHSDCCIYKPNLTYTDIHIFRKKLTDTGVFTDEQVDLTLNEVNNVHVSEISPYNKIWIKFIPDTSCYWEARVTALDDVNYGPGVGTLARSLTNVAGSTLKETAIAVTTTNFPLGNIEYRIGLYAQSQIDGTWDATYILVTRTGLIFKPNNYDAIEVIAKTPIVE